MPVNVDRKECALHGWEKVELRCCTRGRKICERFRTYLRKEWRQLKLNVSSGRCSIEEATTQFERDFGTDRTLVGIVGTRIEIPILPPTHLRHWLVQARSGTVLSIALVGHQDWPSPDFLMSSRLWMPSTCLRCTCDGVT